MVERSLNSRSLLIVASAILICVLVGSLLRTYAGGLWPAVGLSLYFTAGQIFMWAVGLRSEYLGTDAGTQRKVANALVTTRKQGSFPENAYNYDSFELPHSLVSASHTSVPVLDFARLYARDGQLRYELLTLSFSTDASMRDRENNDSSDAELFLVTAPSFLVALDLLAALNSHEGTRLVEDHVQGDNRVKKFRSLATRMLFGDTSSPEYNRQLLFTFLEAIAFTESFGPRRS